MEFFSRAAIRTDAEELQRRLRIAALPRWCASIQTVFDDQGASGEIYCVWGSFRVQREELADGVRFSLPGCPNALQWTVTAGPAPDSEHIVVHLTINRPEHDADFVASLRQFVNDWRVGLESRWCYDTVPAQER